MVRWGGRHAGAGGTLGRAARWGGRHAGAGGTLGRAARWGGRHAGAGGTLGRAARWGGRHAGKSRTAVRLYFVLLDQFVIELYHRIVTLAAWVDSGGGEVALIGSLHLHR